MSVSCLPMRKKFEEDRERREDSYARIEECLGLLEEEYKESFKKGPDE